MNTRVHISLPVSDLPASVDFYHRFLGSEPTKVESDYANFRLDTPPIHLALVESSAPPPRAHVHYGVEVFADDDLASWRERVEAAGVATRVEEDTTCCYARSDKFWVRDPDGREWEVWHRHAEADSMGGSTALPMATEADACCAPGECC